MGIEKEIKFIHARFKRVSRPDREKILCALIRINYGTPWDGDLELLKNFFPDWYHQKLVLGGLTETIEALSPFADEPTDAGFVTDEPTVLEGEITEAIEISGVRPQSGSDPIGEQTVTIF